MRVKDCMTKQVISVGAGEPVSVAARLMARYNLGALPVRGTDGQLEGMLTDRDIVLRCIAAERSPKAVRVREVMTRSVAAAAPDTDAAAAAGIMAARQVRRLPVTEEGRLVGMVSLADLSRRPDYMMEAAEALEDICAGVRRMDGQEPVSYTHLLRRPVRLKASMVFRTPLAMPPTGSFAPETKRTGSALFIFARLAGS